jgi:hypothetical protein
MNPKKKSRRCRASASIQALDLAISRFIHSLGWTSVGPGTLINQAVECYCASETHPHEVEGLDQGWNLEL